MGLPGHEFLKNRQQCTCGWRPFLNVSIHPQTQWTDHLREVETMSLKRTGISREVALQMLRSLAASTGDSTNPTEDVIDLAQAVLALLGE